MPYTILCALPLLIHLFIQQFYLVDTCYNNKNPHFTDKKLRHREGNSFDQGHPVESGRNGIQRSQSALESGLVTSLLE